MVPGLQARLTELQILLRQAQEEIARLEAENGDSSEEDALRATITDLNRRLAIAETTIRRLNQQLEGEQIDLDTIVVSRRIADERALRAAVELAESYVMIKN